jgi:type II secretory pathway pseudopilin PulG
MVVVLILGILIGLVVGLGRHARDSGDRARARVELAELQQGLARYFATHDCYPHTGDVALPITNIWLEVPPWAPRTAHRSEDGTPGGETNRWTLLYYLPADFPLLDPWRNPYYYMHDSTNAPLSYSLFSHGPISDDKNARITLQP